LRETELFSDISSQQMEASFQLVGKLLTSKAYQQWLDSADNNSAITRDPFISTYTLQQLKQGSGGNANYPALENRITDYIQQVNVGGKRLDRITPYLVAELVLAGTYFTPDLQGAIFQTPNQKEVFTNSGARCYNGRFIGIQKGRVLFEELSIVAEGKTETVQVVKTTESSCLSVSLPPKRNSADTALASESVARSKLPTIPVTLNVDNVELRSLLLLLHELSGRQFSYVLDQSVPQLCISINRQRIPFGEILLAILQDHGLTILAEGNIFRIIAHTQLAEASSPTMAISLVTPPSKGKFGSSDFSAEAIALSLSDVELTEVTRFLTSKYGVEFLVSEEAKKAKATISLTGLPWTEALTALLRSARLGVFIEGERIIILPKTDLLRLQKEGKVKLE
jgi:hypothetical protein